MIKKRLGCFVVLLLLFSLVLSFYGIRFLIPDFQIVYIRLILLMDIVITTVTFLLLTEFIRHKYIKDYADRLRKHFLLFPLEIGMFCLVLLFSVPFIYNLQYAKTIGFPLFFAVVITVSAFLWLMVNMILIFTNDPAELFATIAIPLCMSYCFLIVPNGVPDENRHFAKAYLTSTGVFKNEFEYYVPRVFNQFKDSYYHYDQMYKILISKTDYSDLAFSGEILQNNFIYYLIPAFVFFLGRMLKLSLMLSYIFARMLNSFFYIFMGYEAIKKIPLGKYVLLLYMLNPVCIQQASSLSYDVVLHALSFYSIAYMLDLALNEREIQYLDIIILGGMMCTVTLLKPNYIIIYGLILLCWKQIFKMSFRKWILVGIIIALIPLSYYANSLLAGVDNYITEHDNYKISNGIDEFKQLQFLIGHPTFIFKLLVNTVLQKKGHYIYTYSGAYLSCFNIAIPKWIAFGFQGLIVVSTFFTSDGQYINRKGKLWCFILSILLTISIFLALYLSWTPIGAPDVYGVQGRYFIPFIILFFLSMIGEKNRVSKYSGVFISIIAFLFQLCAMFFIFIQYI